MEGKTLKELIYSFKLTKEERAGLNTTIPDSFRNIASAMLSGNFTVSSGNRKVLVIPTVLEFYYHEEPDGGHKDYIVYHRNSLSRKKDDKALFPTGFLHNHVSGIDLTFEHENEGKVRASVLIREFKVIPQGFLPEGMSAFSLEPGKKDSHSTRMYAALFSMFSILDGFSVVWEDGDHPVDVKWDTRHNVQEYDNTGHRTDKPCHKEWQAINTLA